MQIKDIPYVSDEKDNLVNIVGNVVGKLEVLEHENKFGESFSVVIFFVASKDDNGNKVYHNCSAYGEKGLLPKQFQQGDFVNSLGKLGHLLMITARNTAISGYLKAREQMKEQVEKKD